MAAPVWGDEASFNRWAAWVNMSATFTQQGIIREVHHAYCVVSPLRNLDAKLHCAIPPMFRGSGLFTVDCVVTFKNLVGGSDVGTEHILEYCDCGAVYPTTTPEPTTTQPPRTTITPTHPPATTTPAPTTTPEPTTTVAPTTTTTPTTPVPTTTPAPTTPSPTTTLPPWPTTTTTTTTTPAPTTTPEPEEIYCCDGVTVISKTLAADLVSVCDDMSAGCPGSSVLTWNEAGGYWEGPYPKPPHVAEGWTLRVFCDGAVMKWAQYENGVQVLAPAPVDSLACSPFEATIHYYEGGALLCCGGIEEVTITITESL